MSAINIPLLGMARRETQRKTASAFALRTLEALELWSERRHQRKALRELPDHILHDIAVSPADVEAEARKPFWRA